MVAPPASVAAPRSKIPPAAAATSARKKNASTDRAVRIAEPVDTDRPEERPLRVERSTTPSVTASSESSSWGMRSFTVAVLATV